MSAPRNSAPPRDPNLGQKEAEKEKTEFDEEQPVEQDELEPMKREEEE